ncbi:hypothetical protein ACFL6U_06990 [Planctomycetota bacterium]
MDKSVKTLFHYAKKVKEAILVISGALFILLFLLFGLMGLKGCVVKVWKSPTEPITYSLVGEDDRSLSMIFMPEHKTYIVYTDEQNSFVEMSLTQMRGTYGTHYFWRLWVIDGPNINVGLRIYPKGAKPVVMETTVLDKYIQGNGSETLPGNGDRTHPVLLFTEDALCFEGMWLKQEPTEMKLITLLNQYLTSESQ